MMLLKGPPLSDGERPPSSTMSGSSPPVGALEAEGWAHDSNGEMAEGRPQSKGNIAVFKHSRELQTQDALSFKYVNRRRRGA